MKQCCMLCCSSIMRNRSSFAAAGGCLFGSFGANCALFTITGGLFILTLFLAGFQISTWSTQEPSQCYGKCNECDDAFGCRRISMLDATALSDWDTGSDLWQTHRICWFGRCFYILRFEYFDSGPSNDFNFGSVFGYSEGAYTSYYAGNSTTPWDDLFGGVLPMTRSGLHPWSTQVDEVCLNFIKASDRNCLATHLSYYDATANLVNMTCYYTYECDGNRFFDKFVSADVPSHHLFPIMSS